MQRKLVKKSGMMRKMMLQTWKKSMDLNACGVMENMNQMKVQKNGLTE